MPINWNEFTKIPPPWAHIISCSYREIDSIFHYHVPTNLGFIARIIRGERCTTEQKCFQEWAAALQFPYYFGSNWDAFDECITDLEWLPAKGYIFIVTKANLFLSEKEDSLTRCVRILNNTAKEWSEDRIADLLWPRLSVPFHIIFHCEPESENETRNRLEQAGISNELNKLPVDKLS